jgi:hypothetical protein
MTGAAFSSVIKREKELRKCVHFAQVITRKWVSLGTLLAGLIVSIASAGAQDATKIATGTISTFAGMYGSSLNANTIDNQPASQIPFGDNSTSLLNAITADKNGNIYVAVGLPYGSYSYVGVIYAGGPVPPLLKFRTPSPTQGNFYYIVGPVTAGTGGDIVKSGRCQNGTCGDGGSALQALLNGPAGLTFDGSGNLYIADGGANAIRRVDAATGIISTVAGDLQHKSAGYSGEGKKAAGTLLAYPIGIDFDTAGNLYIAEFFNHIIRKVDTGGKISTVAGTDPPIGTLPSGPGHFNSANLCTSATAPCGENGNATNARLSFPAHVFVSGDSLYIADEGDNVVRKISNGIITMVAGKLLNNCTAAPCGDGGPATSANLSGPSFVYLDADNNLLISDLGTNSLRVVDASGNISTAAGETAPSQSSGYTGDGGQASHAKLSAPNQFVFDQRGNLYIADEANNVVRKVTPITLKSQKITFDSIPDHTYGDAAFNLEAVASSGLPVSYTVTGPATISDSTLNITGAGKVSVTANQSGDDMYDSAAPVTQSFQVNPAILTVTAASFSLIKGTPIPANLQIQTITGFVNGDTQASVLTGAPSLAVIDSQGTVQPAGSTPPSGQYMIRITRGTLSAGPNYSFDLVNGILQITGSKPQTISFSPLSNIAYGAPAFSLNATSSSNLPVAYTYTGPVKLQQSSITILGVGIVSITATQLGDDTYAAAPSVTQIFTVNPAVLTIKANDAKRGYGEANPSFTYTPTGFVYADTSAVLSGMPTFSTTAVQDSPGGQYPITIVQGTLSAQNYTFNFVNGTLTVTPASQTIKFQKITDVAFNFGTGQGVIDYPLQATASSHLPITYTATGPVVINSGGTSFSVTGVGPASITASQAGNSQYAAASATNTFVIEPGTVTIAALSASRPFGADNPLQFGYQFPAGAPPANLYSGVPDLTTTATSQSPPGTYPINASQGTLTSEVYSFQFLDNVLTVTPPSTYALSVNPTSITVPRGQSRQVTVTLTPVNNYIGSVTIECNGLPAGVTCTSSPAAITTVPAANTGQASPVQGTLTISAGQVVASDGDPFGAKTNIWVAGLSGIGGIVSCLLIVVFRNQAKQSKYFWSVIVLLTFLASIGSVIACGGGTGMGMVATGTTQITVTGAGTQSPGTGETNQSVDLTITIQ